MSPGSADGATLGVFLLYGLLGGAHCLGMCGPLVTVYGDRMAGGDAVTWHQLRQHALFNLGRTAGYAVIGAAVAAAGAAVYGAGAILSVAGALRGVVGVGVGVVIAAIGVGYLRGGTGKAPGSGDGPLAALDGVAARVTAALTDRIDRRADGPGIAALGALHGLLPCPILYPAFLYAFALGAPVEGALVLAALGLGTVPSLFLYGTALSAVDPGSRRRLHRALGAVVLVAALVPLTRGLAALGAPVPTVPLPMPSVPGAAAVLGTVGAPPVRDALAGIATTLGVAS